MFLFLPSNKKMYRSFKQKWIQLFALHPSFLLHSRFSFYLLLLYFIHSRAHFEWFLWVFLISQTDDFRFYIHRFCFVFNFSSVVFFLLLACYESWMEWLFRLVSWNDSCECVIECLCVCKQILHSASFSVTLPVSCVFNKTNGLLFRFILSREIHRRWRIRSQMNMWRGYAECKDESGNSIWKKFILDKIRRFVHCTPNSVGKFINFEKMDQLQP